MASEKHRLAQPLCHLVRLCTEATPRPFEHQIAHMPSTPIMQQPPRCQAPVSHAGHGSLSLHSLVERPRLAYREKVGKMVDSPQDYLVTVTWVSGLGFETVQTREALHPAAFPKTLGIWYSPSGSGPTSVFNPSSFPHHVSSSL